MSPSQTLVLLAGLAGCAPALQAGFEADLSDQGGCGDIYAYGATPDDDVLLLVHVLGEPVLAAYEAGETSFSLVLSAADGEAVEVEARTGNNVGQIACNDFVENYALETTWVAVGGTVGVEASLTADTWETWSVPADVVVTVTDLVLEDQERGDQVTVDSFEIAASVGWLPG